MSPVPLRLIPGARGRCRRIGDFGLVASPLAEPPFPVQATLLEEDTWRVLGAPARLPPVEEPMVRVMTGLINQRPLSPGKVLFQGRRWKAIVIDLEQDPVCREAWVRQAFEQALREATRRGLRALALPLLGSRHGGLDHSRSLEILLEALRQTPGDKGRLGIWLQLPAAGLGPVNERIAAAQPAGQAFPGGAR